MKDVLDWVILIIKFAISLVCLYIHFHIKDIKRFIPALIFFFTCIIVMVFYKLNWFNISYRLNLSVNILYVCFLVLSYYTVYIKDLNIPSLHGEITYFSQRNIRWSQKKYSSANYYTSGCGPTVIAMIASLKDKTATPYSVGEWLKQTPFFVKKGTRIDAVAEYFHQRNIKWKAIGKDQKSVIYEDLNKGALFAICFSKHIVLAVKSNGKNIIVDPASPNRMYFCNFDRYIDKIYREHDFTNFPFPIVGIYFEQ